MFAAAKKGTLPCGAEFMQGLFLRSFGGLKKISKKDSKKHCGIKKRVLYLHPLKR
jgi:hypothetical protein